MSITVSCPSCQRTLRVPEKLLGKRVKCPACQETFTAEEAGGKASAAVQPGPAGGGSPFEFEDEAPASPPSGRARDEEEYDDDYEERPSRRRRRSGGGMKPHRGSTIQMLGILSFFIGAPVTGIIAWVMGNADLKEMAAGRMDPEGEAQTKTGRTCGMISTFLSLGSILICCPCIILANVFANVR